MTVVLADIKISCDDQSAGHHGTDTADNHEYHLGFSQSEDEIFDDVQHESEPRIRCISKQSRGAWERVEGLGMKNFIRFRRWTIARGTRLTL